jgi:hypothetical protein
MIIDARAAELPMNPNLVINESNVMFHNGDL